MRNGLQDCMGRVLYATSTKSHGYCWTTYACNSHNCQSCADLEIFLGDGVPMDNFVFPGGGGSDG